MCFLPRALQHMYMLQVVTTRSVADELAKPNLDPDCVYEMSQEELWTQSPSLW